MLAAKIFEQVLQSMNTNPVCLIDHLRVVRQARVGSANRNVIRLDAEIIEALLHGDAHCASTSPEPDQKVRLEISLKNIGSELKRVEQEIVRRNESLVHFLFSVTGVVR